MYGGQTGPLSGTIKASQLVMPERELSVAPVYIGAGTLQSPGELSRRGL
jgi:hypothetical protein